MPAADFTVLPPEQQEITLSRVNIFIRYDQRENDYTNGFISLLSLVHPEQSRLLSQLLNEQLGLLGTFNPANFLVLRGVDGYADAEISAAADFCIWFETKIVSGTLREDQVRQHLGILDEKPQTCRYLVLLTPDDSDSSYIRRFLAIDPRIRHLEWRQAYELLESPDGRYADGVFSSLAQQFRDHIQETIFKQDLAGGILKISFGDQSGVYEDSYLSELKAFKWKTWNTPRQYKSLDGTGRKLLLYDGSRQGVTVEMEIGRVVETHSERDYPWSNEIVPGSIRFFDPAIPNERIRSLEYFQDFGVHRKDRNAFRNLTRAQYRLLMADQS